jgi:hypothetical protein
MEWSMQKQFYVSHEGKIVGTFTVPEIAKKLAAGEVHITDYVYDDAVSDWVVIGEHREFKAVDAKPTMKPTEHVDTMSQDSNDWFVLKGDNQTGPFSGTDVIKMLQEKMIFEYDYIWKAGMETWKRVAEITDFNPDSIRTMRESADFKNVFFRRRFKRKEFGGTLIVHDNKKVWHGKSLEVSEAGAGLVMNNAMVLPGQTLYLHFRPSSQVPAFNALVEVVSKKYVKNANSPETPISYGVRFLRIQDDAKKSLQNFIKTKEDERQAA